MDKPKNIKPVTAGHILHDFIYVLNRQTEISLVVILLWKILKEIGIPDHLTYLYMQVKKQQLELDMEQQTGSK